MQHVLIEYDTNTGALLGVYGSLEAVKAARPGVIFRCPFEPDLDAPEYDGFDARSPDCGALRYEIRPVQFPRTVRLPGVVCDVPLVATFATEGLNDA